MNRHHFSATASAVLALLTAYANVYAQTAWDGGGDGINYADNLNWAGDVIPGDSNTNGALIGNGVTQTGIIYNTATSYTSTGAGKANSLLVGTGVGGVGDLTLSGSAGTLTFGGDGYNNAAWIGSTGGTASGATGTVTVSAGKLAITGGSDASINLGVQITGTAGPRNGTLIINGGTVEVGRRILMGANNAATIGNLTISSGTLDMKRTGSNGEGDLGMIRLGSGTNTVNFDGGTAIMTGFRTTEASNVRSNIYFNGTTVRANVTNADFITGSTGNANYQIKNGGLIFDTNTFAVTINDALSNFTGHNGFLRKEGAGTLTLTANNAYSGGTTVNQGTLTVGTGGTLGATTGTLSVNNTNNIAAGTNTILNLATAVDTTVGSLSGTIATPTSGTNTVTINNGGLGRNFTVNQTAPGTYAGVIAGAGSFTLGSLSTNTLTLSNSASSFTGNLVIDKGTLLAVGAPLAVNPTTSALGNPQTVGRQIIVGSGATLNFGNNDAMGNAGSTPQVTVVVNGGTVTNNGNFFTVLGALDLNAGTLASIGGANGTFQAFSLRGTTTVGGSAVSTISSSGSNSAIHLSQVGGNIFNVADSTGNSNVDLSVTGVLAGNNGTGGAGSLLKQGVGTMALSGANTYGGGTTISAGTLLANNTTGSATGTAGVIVNGGTFGGTGVVTGGVTVNGGTFSPGASIESLATGALTFNNDSTFLYELNSSALNGDLVVTTGTLNINPTSTLTFSELVAGTLPVGSKLTLVNYSGAWNNGIFNGYADDSIFTLGSNQWQINYNDTSGGSNFSGEQGQSGFNNYLTITVVPEPSSLAMLAFGMMSLWLFKTKRRLR